METDESLVSFFKWIFIGSGKAGHDPLHYFTKHPERFQTLAYQGYVSGCESCVLGNGMIDFQ